MSLLKQALTRLQNATNAAQERRALAEIAAAESESESTSTSRSSSGPARGPAAQGPDAEFICSHCGKTCSSSRRLVEHEAIHTRPFKCTETGCAAAFTRQDRLHQHMRCLHPPPIRGPVLPPASTSTTPRSQPPARFASGQPAPPPLRPLLRARFPRPIKLDARRRTALEFDVERVLSAVRDANAMER
ncbi:hypothetical protein MKEN_00566600 [Mycena kentingensis (nom. inval.)]|nr:hypothetical protein MKEN_00566600 [Mycena kentingensis (nom. inval.)]